MFHSYMNFNQQIQCLHLRQVPYASKINVFLRHANNRKQATSGHLGDKLSKEIRPINSPFNCLYNLTIEICGYASINTHRPIRTGYGRPSVELDVQPQKPGISALHFITCTSCFETFTLLNVSLLTTWRSISVSL